MLERDWQKDMEVALSIPGNLRVIDKGKDLEIIGINDQDDKQRQLVAKWFMHAKNCWPAALEENRRLWKEYYAVKEENRKLREAMKNFDVLPCVNNATQWPDPPPMDDRWIKAVCKAADLVKREMLTILEREGKKQSE